MSQVLESRGPLAADPQFSEFDYKPVPPLAPASLALGILSGVGVFWDLALVIPAIGIGLAIACLIQIRRSEGLLGGKFPALSGMVLSTLFLVGGGTLHAYTYATEVPPGYERVSFLDDISAKGFVMQDGAFEIHPEVKQLDGKPVFVKGYMYPTRQTEGIQSFVLVKDSGECCFGGQPQLTDMILVEMEPDKAVDFRPGLIAVAGTFHASNERDEAGLNPVYRLDGQFFGPAKTAY